MSYTAKTIRIERAAHPERFCTKCLWRIKHRIGPDTPCPRHPQPEKAA